MAIKTLKEDARRGPPQVVPGLADGGQGREEQAGEGDVVEPHHREILWDPQTAAGGRMQGAGGHAVVQGEDRGRRIGLVKQAMGGPFTTGGREIAYRDQVFIQAQPRFGQSGADAAQPFIKGKRRGRLLITPRRRWPSSSRWRVAASAPPKSSA